MSALVDAEHRSRSQERQGSACGNRRLSTQRCDAERGLRGRRVPGYSSGGSEGRTAERRALPVPAQQLAPQKARGTVREPNGCLGASGWLWAARRAGQRRSAPGTAVAPPRPRLMRKHRPGRRRGGVEGMAQRALPLPRQQSFSPPVVPNPFVHPGGPSAGDKLRLVLLGIILLPLRAICMIILLLLSWLSASVATFHHTGGASVPLKGWRRRMIQTTLSCLTRTLFFVMGFQVKVKGKVASLQEAPIFVAAPHSSFFDAIVSAFTGMPSIVSRAENLSTPVFGTILSSLQPVAVSRQDPDSRKNTVAEISSRALSRGQWPQILIFPEGTCTNRSCLITFKQGAFIPGVPVQPVLLRYPNKLDTVTWTWQGYSLKELCIMTLCQLFTRVEVEFLPVYVPTEEERNDPILFANRVRQTMATALKVPVTDHTFEDCRLMISAGQLTLPMEAGLVEFTKISKKLNLKWNHVREQLDTFAAIASASKGGRIGIEEFAEYLKLPISDVLRELFLLFDRLIHNTALESYRSASDSLRKYLRCSLLRLC
ncbi:lysophosphatidylcholine acyltransferase 2 isoform X2 [Tympanuchus pallidicinctus]|uniref:lysophosphatidylcholine acyltransferase 2 isoform X2 n=1 Tax=Tympanuchus pallidicinctus TaxID=109042 RepID=UPI002286D9CA|nr:lysophosphatidylcholine acyltransferase 2 isoform X2 [Tympanuchus pallidicinctus]